MLAQCCSLEREAAGVQLSRTDNRAEPVSSSLLSKWSYPSDWFLGETSITAASLLWVICFLHFYRTCLKMSTPFRFLWNISKRKTEGKERKRKGKEFFYSEMKLSEFVCIYHRTVSYSLSSTAKLLVMILSNAFYLPNIFSNAWFLKGISVSKTHSTRSQKSRK